MLAERVALLAALSIGGSSVAIASDACVAEEPLDYRMSHFLAPVPCTLAGAQVLSTAALKRLLDARSALLIDVLPAARRPTGLAADAVWSPPPRHSLPSTSSAFA